MCTSPLPLPSLHVLPVPQTCTRTRARSRGSAVLLRRHCRRRRAEKGYMGVVNGEEQAQWEQDSCLQKTPGAKCLAPFLTKAYDLVDRSGAEHIVSWNEEGTAFVVWLPEDLSQFLLPKYFKHCNFSSFIRQLNTYGFRKSAPDRWEFRHDKFQKGKAHLLGEITRRRCEPRVVYPSFLNARDKGPLLVQDTRLLEENEILQRENSEMLLQIAQYKALESELMQHLSHFTAASSKKARLLS